MKKVRCLILWLAAIGALSGCSLLRRQQPPIEWVPLPTIGSAATATPTPTPSSTPMPTLAPTATPSPSRPLLSEAEQKAIAARDIAWKHLVGTLRDKGLPEKPVWAGEPPQVLLGATTYHYTAGEWRAAVSVPVVPPEKVVYQVTVRGPNQFEWTARVTPDGKLDAPPLVTPTPETVQALRGTLHSAPQGSPYDDFIRVVGDKGEEYGIAARDKALEARLVALRNTGRIVKVWGLLQRAAQEHGGAQITVERVEEELPPPTQAPASEFVEGWTGRVRSAPAGASYDDCFEGQAPAGQYGIDSPVRALADQLAAQRNTGTLLRVWGMLDYGVADCGGKRIIVTRIEVVRP